MALAALLPLLFAETPLVSPGESGSAAVVFGCYGLARQWVLESRARLECGALESGDASVLPNNVQLELERALEGEDDAAVGRSVVVRRA